jgi:hypothetical protein
LTIGATIINSSTITADDVFYFIKLLKYNQIYSKYRIITIPEPPFPPARPLPALGIYEPPPPPPPVFAVPATPTPERESA